MRASAVRLLSEQTFLILAVTLCLGRGGLFWYIYLLVEAEEGHQRILQWLSIGNATGTFPRLRKMPGSRLLREIKLRMTSAKPRHDFLALGHIW
jgi:hypothetical protein